MLDFVQVADELVRGLSHFGEFLKTHSGLAVTGFISSLTTLITLLLLGSHRRAQRYSWDAQRLLYLHGYLSNPEQMSARRMLRSKREVERWETEEDEQADKVSAAYDQAGILLLAPGLVNSKQTRYLLRSSWGKSICEQYELIEKREKHRALHGPVKSHGLGNHFTHFGALVQATIKAQEPTIWEWWFSREECEAKVTRVLQETSIGAPQVPMADATNRSLKE